MSAEVASTLTNLLQTYQKQLEEKNTELEKARTLTKDLEAAVRDLQNRLMKASEELLQLRGQVKDDSKDDPTTDKLYWQNFRSTWGEVMAAACAKAYTRLRMESTCSDVYWPAPPVSTTSWGLSIPFILWAPRRQGTDTLKCPHCQGTLSPSKLSEPRRVFSMSSPLLYVTEIYQCSKSGCRKTLLGDADAILQQCPRAVANSLPILKTQKYGVCHDLADLILSIATTSMSISELHTTLTEVYAMRYHRQVAAFYCKKIDFKKKKNFKHDHESRSKGFAGFAWNPGQENFPQEAPPTDWLPPSLDFFEDLQLSLLQARRAMYDSYMQSIGATIGSFDHTFKIAQCLWSGKEKPFRSSFAGFSEFGEVFTLIYTRNESFETLNKCLEDLSRRPTMAMKVIYVDNCCAVRSKLMEFFPHAVVLLDLWHWLNRLWRSVKATNGPSVESFRHLMRDVTMALKEPLSTVLGAKSDLKAWEKKIPPPKELLARLTLCYSRCTLLPNELQTGDPIPWSS